MIWKPDNTYRFCLDFRKFNSVTKKDAYLLPLPRIDSILQKLRRAKYISKLDINKGFQRLVDNLISPEMKPHVLDYLYDIIIVTETFEEHLKWLSQVLNKINDANFNFNKCEFCCSQVKYIGCVVDDNGLHVDSDKIVSILEYPIQKNVKELRRFLGIASWYRRLIPNFASIFSFERIVA